MKRCPSCNRTFDDSQMFCSTDGMRLEETSEDSFDPEATLMSPPSRRPSSELPPPDAYNTNVGTSGQFEQTPPPPQPQNQEQPSDDPYKTNVSSWTNPPLSQSPALQAPAAPPATAKKGMSAKLLIGVSLGCLGLILLIVVGVILFFTLYGSPMR